MAAQKAFQAICSAMADHPDDNNNQASLQFYEGLGIKHAGASACSLLACVALATPDDTGGGATSRVQSALVATTT